MSLEDVRKMNDQAFAAKNEERQQQLHTMFADLDTRYFDGRLIAAGYRVSFQLLSPGRPVYFIDPDGRPDAILCPHAVGGGYLKGICCLEIRQIFIARMLSFGKPAWRKPLLHEMAHAAVHLDQLLAPDEDPHGARFQAEMERLAKAGAKP